MQMCVGLTPCFFGKDSQKLPKVMGFLRGVISSQVERKDLRFLVQGDVHSLQGEVALGVALERPKGVVVEQQADGGPVELQQDLLERFADVDVAAHHAREGGVVGLEREGLHQPPRCEDRQPPHPCETCHRPQHVVTQWSQERICTEITYIRFMNVIFGSRDPFFYLNYETVKL